MSIFGMKNKNWMAMGVLSLCVLAVSMTVAEARSNKLKGKLALMQGSWKGSGTFQGRYFVCHTRIHKRIIRGICSEGNETVRTRGRLKGRNRFTTSWSANGFSGVTSYSQIKRSGHIMFVNVYGQGSATLRMRRR